jgi:hypothetical protein
MNYIYHWIARRPGWSILGFVALLVVLATLPVSFLERITPWQQSPDWAHTILQFGALLMVLVGGVIPIAKWQHDRIKLITEAKPIVVTDRLADGNHQVRNIGNAPAFNVWLVVADLKEPTPLGSLDSHEARILSASVVQTINHAVNGRHILLAAARPGPRPYTVTFNVAAVEAAFRHGFDDNPPKDRLCRNGTVEEYLEHERASLLEKLNAFTGLIMHRQAEPHQSLLPDS